MLSRTAITFVRRITQIAPNEVSCDSERSFAIIEAISRADHGPSIKDTRSSTVLSISGLLPWDIRSLGSVPETGKQKEATIVYPSRYEEGTERGLPTGEGTYLAIGQGLAILGEQLGANAQSTSGQNQRAATSADNGILATTVGDPNSLINLSYP
ncbi:hypothetical protein V1478_008209, partial [Vespula squamosa]